jgi:diguanylate cyclase
MVLVKPLQSLDADAPAVLLLRYPLARALAPYRSLLETVVALALLGMILVAVGSWQLSRSLTRPLSALEEAAHRLQRGEEAQVTAETNDEIGRLANSFNAMAAEIRERERRIIHLAHHDTDTDLLSRAGLEREIAGRRTAPDRILVVAAIGLDRFVEVRGAIGHALSSRLMAEVGQRLAALNPDCSVSRLATDTLGLLFEARNLDEALSRADQVHAACEAPLRLQDNTIDVSVTIGLAARGLHADSPAELIERASIALDQSRASRRKAAVFDLEVYGDPASNLSLMSEMRRGMAEGHMRVHYQPKLDLRQGLVTGVEALVRWTHPQRGYLPPDSFIGMAEETGHIRSLTDWVLQQAIADQKLLAAQGQGLEVAINISGRLLGDIDFAESAVDVARTAIGPLCFEITETSVIENPDLALTIIERFAKAGLKVSIDDYGAGFSSLAYLKQIPADELKIDKAFVLQMDESQKDRLLVRSTVDLAHSLGLRVTAEGVETDTALALLTGMGCDLAQGFGIARPMTLENVVAFLNGDQAPRPKLPQPKARLA